MRKNPQPSTLKTLVEMRDYFERVRTGDVEARGEWVILVLSDPRRAAEMLMCSGLPMDHDAVQVLAEAKARGLIQHLLRPSSPTAEEG